MKTRNQSWLENTQAALLEWRKLDPATVKLAHYRSNPHLDTTPSCGSPACFGGWLPHLEYFRALGVVALNCGVPGLPRSEGPYLGHELHQGREVAFELFGSVDLFEMRGSECDVDLMDEIGISAFNKTLDWALVLNRLEYNCSLLT